MKKTIFLFLLYLAVSGAVHVKAQVRIGGGSAAHPSSILDLNPSDTTSAGGGLLLPRVHLDSKTDTGVFGVNPRKGLMVYNLNEDDDISRPAEGIYCYDGEKWLPVNPSTPKYKYRGDLFEIKMTPQPIWMGNDGELTKLLEITFDPKLPDKNDLGGCTMEYIGYLTDTVENKVIEFALTPDWQIANGENSARVYLQIANLDSVKKGRIYELSCAVRVSQYTTDTVNAGYVVYGTGAWVGDRRWINVAPANVGTTIQSLPAQLDHTPNDVYDPTVYGDLYQWGRRKDGHQLRTADTTDTYKTATEGIPVDSLDDANGQIQGVDSGKFIQRANEAKDWRDYPGDPNKNNSITFPADGWTWANNYNNPCETDGRLPTAEEWIQIFNPDNNASVWKDGGDKGVSGYEIKPDGIARPTSFFLPAAGSRNSDDGQLSISSGNYWSSTTHGDFSLSVSFDGDTIVPENRSARAHGFSVRCVANGEALPEPALPEYTGGPFTFTAISKQIWMGRGDDTLNVAPAPVSLTFGSGSNYRAEYVWSFYTDKEDGTELFLSVVTAGPELQMSTEQQGLIKGGEVRPEGERLEEGKVYRLYCQVVMGAGRDFESHTIDAGYAVYGTGAWIGPGKWLNVANANVGADQNMKLSDQLGTNHRSGYDKLVMGDYFQWGRAADGHQVIGDGNDTVRGIVPAHVIEATGEIKVNPWAGKFILSDTVSDWREYPDSLPSDEKRKVWYWRTDSNQTGVDPCGMGDKWFVMTLSHWDSIREHNRLAWLDTDLARGVAVYPNGSDDVSFYLPVSGARDYNSGKLYPNSVDDWRNTWATGIWLNTPVPETYEIEKAYAKAIGLTWSSGSDPKINIGSSNARVSGLPIRCVRNSD